MSSRIREIFAGLPLDSIARRPNPNSWSIAECVAHLTLTTDAYEPEISASIAGARRQNLLSSGRSFRMDMPGRMLAWWLEPPYRLKSKAPAIFVPGVKDPGSVLPDFMERQELLFRLLAEADGLAIDQLKIASPFAKQFRYSLYSAFKLIPAHQRRHVWQAEGVGRALRA